MGNQYTKEKLEENKRHFAAASKGDLTTYYSMFGSSFQSKVNLLSQIICDAHYLTLGTYKENLLKNTLQDFLPNRYSIGSGFVLFPQGKSAQVNSGDEDEDNHLRQVSRQLDLIIYNSADYPLIFNDSGFVVVRPEAVRAIIEVKGMLTQEETSDAIGLFIDYGEKWKKCRALYKSGSYYPTLKRPSMFLMSWDISVDKNGYPKTDGARLRKKIVETYKEKLNNSDIPGFPLLNNAYIYNDCIVQATHIFESSEFGYHTLRGHLTRANTTGKVELIGDKTVSDLLFNIYHSIESSPNPSFTNLDGPVQLDVCPHEHQGFEPWLKGDDWNLVDPSHFND
jgi:hypothetical protein